MRKHKWALWFNALAIVSLLVSPMLGVRAAYAADLWTVVSSPNDGTGDNQLWGVSALKPGIVVAVGSKVSGGLYKALIERWNGTSWSLATSYPSGTAHAELFGVITVPGHSPNTDIFWAAGYQEGTNRTMDAPTDVVRVDTAKTMIQRSDDDGASWSLVSSPNPNPTPTGTGTNVLQAVTSVDANRVWAVGYYRPNGGGAVQPLIEKWDGLGWSIIPNPAVLPEGDNYLYGVDAVSADDIWAVGYTVSLFSGTNMLLLHWNGLTWTVGFHDIPGNGSSTLFGVECLTTSSCWGAGAYTELGLALWRTLTERWTGTGSWSRIPSPNQPTRDNFLYGVWSVSQNWTWAVGNLRLGGNFTLIERWDGIQWNIVSSPSPSSFTSLRSVTVVPGTSSCAGGDSWAVGFYRDSATQTNKTLIERYTITPTCHNP